MDWLQYEFMQRALAMGLLSGATCGVLGVFIVLWRIGFLGICISHAAFAGALLALWGGLPALPGALIGSVGAASVAGPLTRKATFTPDAAVSIIFSVMLSLAILALGMLPESQTDGLTFLWGNLLTAQWSDIGVMGGITVVLVGFLWLFFKEIQATLTQREAAEAMGLPVKAIYYGSLTLLSLIVAFSLQSIGGLLIYALMVTPAVTALQLCSSLKATFWSAAGFGALSVVIGLVASTAWAIPTGVAIVLSATVLLMVVYAISPKRHSFRQS